jgi:uncharacterized lipoprotein YmbA
MREKMNRLMTPARLGGCAIAAAALFGCASPPTHYLGIESVAAAAPAAMAYAGPQIEILTVTLPPEVDRAELLRKTGPGQYQVRDFEHWVAPLGGMVRQALTADLAARLPPGSVIDSEQGKTAGTADVSVHILALNTEGTAATLTVNWSWALPSPPPRAWHTYQLNLVTQLPDDGGPATAAAFSKLVGELADRMAAQLAAPPAPA